MSDGSARMLERVGVVVTEDCEAIVRLERFNCRRSNAANSEMVAGLEDAYEHRGAADQSGSATPGKRLHTGRSRNDQVATDIRLYLR